jgi:hypothetical protein
LKGIFAMKIHFLTTVTNNRFLGLLRPHLESALKHHPGSTATVIHHKITPDRLVGLTACFPEVEFLAQGLTAEETPEKTISGKIRWFLKAITSVADGTPVVLIDCDTLIVRPLDVFFETGFDLAYTWKEDGFALNTGVLLAHAGPKLESLLEHYCRLVEETFREPDKLEIARSRAGAVDQYSLMKIIHPDKEPLPWKEMPIKTRSDWYDGPHVVQIGADEIRLHGFNCIDLNETRSVPITERTHVIHYKSGWQKILLDGALFTAKRPQSECREMHDYWKAASLSAYHRLAENSLLSITPEQERKFRSLNLDWVEHGILHSEMLAVCAAAERLGVKRIIESGRWLGQSTLWLSRYFEGAPVDIVSIDYFRNEIGRQCEKRLAGRRNVRLLYGDTLELLPGLIMEANTPALLLIDGPKGRTAAALIKRVMERCPNLVAAFLHDCYRGSEAREAVEEFFECRAYTDQKEFLRRYAALDAGLTLGEAGPNKYSGIIEEDSLSYGPTLAMILPEDPQPRRRLGVLELLSWKIRGRLAQACAYLRSMRAGSKKKHLNSNAAPISRLFGVPGNHSLRR